MEVIIVPPVETPWTSWFISSPFNHTHYHGPKHSKNWTLRELLLYDIVQWLALTETVLYFSIIAIFKPCHQSSLPTTENHVGLSSPSESVCMWLILSHSIKTALNTLSTKLHVIMYNSRAL